MSSSSNNSDYSNNNNSIINQLLHNGQIIKNYKELCSILGLETKSGDSKVAQLKELERYFSYKRDGHKFIIEEIYQKPLPKIDGRTQRNVSDLTRYMTEVLVRRLSNQNDDIYKYATDIVSGTANSVVYHQDVACQSNRIYLSKNTMLKLLGMVNDVYFKSYEPYFLDLINNKANNKEYYDNNKYYDNKIEITHKDITLFYSVVSGRLTQLIKRTLTHLEKTNYYCCSSSGGVYCNGYFGTQTLFGIQTLVKKKESVNNHYNNGSNGSNNSSSIIMTEADADDLEIIEKAKKSAMKQLHCWNYSGIIASNQISEYNIVLKSILKSYGLYAVTNQFYLSKPQYNYNNEDSNNLGNNTTDNNKSIEQLMLALNNEVANCLLSYVNTIYNKYVEDCKKIKEKEADQEELLNAYKSLFCPDSSDISNDYVIDDITADDNGDILSNNKKTHFFFYSHMIKYPDDFVSKMEILIDKLIRIYPNSICPNNITN